MEDFLSRVDMPVGEYIKYFYYDQNITGMA